MQRILSGSARGRSLKPLPKSFPVRPILGRIKKSLFDILQTRLPQSRFLDLFAGTGSVGMEALSRDAAFSCFIEQNKLCAKHITENLEKLGFLSKAVVIRADVMGHLSHLPGPFDIIFMGPPYVDREKKALSLTAPTLVQVAKYELLSKNGIIISQRHKKEIIQTVPAPFEQYREEKYGDTLLAFFRFLRTS
jgi:16S rRNA (guanine966-N2)-methyltransferase